MEHLNKIRLAAENQMRERARKQAEARVAELERGGRLNELTPSRNGNNRTSPNKATAPASAMKTPSGGGSGGVGTSPYATPAPDFASSAGSMEEVAVAVASLQSELEAMRRRQAAFNDELESRIDARSPAAVPQAAIDEAVTHRIQESVASIIAPYVEATIDRVRDEMRAQILAETNAKISASNDAAEATVERIGGLLGAAEAAARGAKEAAAAAEEAAVASEQRTERAEAHAADAERAVAKALDAKRSDASSEGTANAGIAALEVALGDANGRVGAAEGEAREAAATAKAAVRAAEQTAREVDASVKSAEARAREMERRVAEMEAKMEQRAVETEARATEAERRATEAERRATEAERRATEAEARAKEADARAAEAMETAAAPAPPPPPVEAAAAAPGTAPVSTSGPDTGAVAASVRADLAGDIASLKRAADEAVEVARQARAAQTELRAKCMDEVRSIRAAVKSLAPVVGATSAAAPPSPIKDGLNETEDAKETITAKLRTELDALKRRVENLAGIASTSKSAEDAANEASKMAKSSMRAVDNIEGEMKKLAVKVDDAVASAASALAAAAAAAEDAAAAAESADAAEPKTDGASIALVDEVAARVEALQTELKETAVIVQTNAEGIAFLGQQAMLTAKKDDVEELRASVNKTAERARKETDALKAATQTSLEELEGRTKKLERGARRQSENREATPSAPTPAVETVSPQAVSALEKRMAALEASTAVTPLSSEATDVAAGGDVKERVERFESVASELTARVERLQEAVGVEMLAHMKRLDAKLKTVEQSLGEAKQQGTPTNAKQESGKPGKLDRANAARLASAEKAAAESRSTAEDAAEKAKLASEKAKAALAAVAEHAATTERVKEAETKLRELSGEIEKFRADVAEMEVSSATNTADVVAIEGEWASARRHLKDLEQSVWKSMVMIREEAGVGTPSSDAGAATPATPATAPAATAGTPLATGRTPETPMSGLRALFSRGRRSSTALRSTESDSARRLRARRTESPERRDVARSEAVIEALDMGSPTRPARRSANRER